MERPVTGDSQLKVDPHLFQLCTGGQLMAMPFLLDQACDRQDAKRPRRIFLAAERRELRQSAASQHDLVRRWWREFLQMRQSCTRVCVNEGGFPQFRLQECVSAVPVEIVGVSAKAERNSTQ